MRHSYRPDIPPQPQSYRTQILDHLRLVAGMFEELGITEVIDQATQQDPEMRIVTAGHAVKAMVLNGLGFINQQLYLVPHFFQNKPISRLIAPGIAHNALQADYGSCSTYSMVSPLHPGHPIMGIPSVYSPRNVAAPIATSMMASFTSISSLQTGQR